MVVLVYECGARSWFVRTSQVLKRPYKETRGRTRRILGVYMMNLRVDSGRSSVVDFICRYGPRRIILYHAFVPFKLCQSARVLERGLKPRLLSLISTIDL